MEAIQAGSGNLLPDILLVLFVLLMAAVIYLYFSKKMKLHKDYNTKIVSEYSQSLQRMEAEKSKLSDIIKENDKAHHKNNTFYFYYSLSQARVTRNNQLGRHSTYIKHYVDGKEFTEMLHISQPQVPSYKDAELVFTGKPQIESIPYTNMDKPVSTYAKKLSSTNTNNLNLAIN